MRKFNNTVVATRSLARRQFFQETATTVMAVAGGMGFVGCDSPGSVLSDVKDDTTAGSAGNRPAYRLVRAEGGHRALGQQHGEQAVEEIKTHVDYIRRSQQLSRERLQAKALRFQPLFERHCPHLLAEIEGLAEGAGVSLAEALAVNIRGELEKVENEGCTTYAMGKKCTADGEILIGQNGDMMQPNLEMGYVLNLRPAGKPQILIWTFGGMIGYHGMNNAGVAQFANALGGGPSRQFALPHYPVKRLILECSKLSEVLEIFDRVSLASNGNYILCGGDGNILDVEATTAGPRLLQDRGAGFLAHSNHFLCAPHANQQNHDASLPDSFHRLDRMNEMIQAESGSVTVEHVKKFLSDHSNHPTSVCRHPQTSDLGDGFEVAGRTVVSMIAEPAHGRLHVALGNPCESRFVTYSMDEKRS